MENVEIKEEKKVKKEVKKEVKRVNAKKDLNKVKFMEARNEARLKAGHPLAYSKEEIEAYK